MLETVLLRLNIAAGHSFIGQQDVELVGLQGNLAQARDLPEQTAPVCIMQVRAISWSSAAVRGGGRFEAGMARMYRTDILDSQLEL